MTHKSHPDPLVEHNLNLNPEDGEAAFWTPEERALNITFASVQDPRLSTEEIITAAHETAHASALLRSQIHNGQLLRALQAAEGTVPLPKNGTEPSKEEMDQLIAIPVKHLAVLAFAAGVAVHLIPKAYMGGLLHGAQEHEQGKLAVASAGPGQLVARAKSGDGNVGRVGELLYGPAAPTAQTAEATAEATDEGTALPPQTEEPVSEAASTPSAKPINAGPLTPRGPAILQ